MKKSTLAALLVLAIPVLIVVIAYNKSEKAKLAINSLGD